MGDRRYMAPTRKLMVAVICTIILHLTQTMVDNSPGVKCVDGSSYLILIAYTAYGLKTAGQSALDIFQWYYLSSDCFRCDLENRKRRVQT